MAARSAAPDIEQGRRDRGRSDRHLQQRPFGGRAGGVGPPRAGGFLHPWRRCSHDLLCVGSRETFLPFILCIAGHATPTDCGAAAVATISINVSATAILHCAVASLSGAIAIAPFR